MYRWSQYINAILIEPVGIETTIAVRAVQRVIYFNRTSWNWNFIVWYDFLLKNYFNRTSWNWNEWTFAVFWFTTEILIEPVGIETPFSAIFYLQRGKHFNRTSWNWNFIKKRRCFFANNFNRTSWNWNRETLKRQNDKKNFNRTSWNWNKVRRLMFGIRWNFNRTSWNWNNYIRSK